MLVIIMRHLKLIEDRSFLKLGHALRYINAGITRHLKHLVLKTDNF